MKKSLLYFFITLLISQFALSQNEAKKWCFGGLAGLDFMTSPPTIFYSAGNTGQGVSSVSDPAGNLLFYSDGSNLTAASGNTIANGAGLLGGLRQGILTCKQPGNNFIYYVFYSTGTGLLYSIVDMSLAAGMGSVTVKNATLSAIYPANAIAGTKHCNGRDIWITSLDEFQFLSSPAYRSYLLTPSGINTTPVVSLVGNTQQSYSMKFSPSGKKIAVATIGLPIEFCDFNTSTGSVSNPIHFGSSSLGYLSVEFSPDETKLYGVGFGTSNRLRQWNLCAANPTAITASEYMLTSPSIPGGFQRNALQLGPNDKIYAGLDSTNHLTYLGVINNPNAAATSCNYVDMGQSVAPTVIGLSTDGLPNFVSSYFYHPPVPAPFTNSLTLTQSCRTVSFTAPPNPTTNCAASNYSVTGITWFFGDPASGTNSSTISNPVHTYTGPGTYTAMLIFTYVCGADTLRQPITISGPSLSVSNSSVTCAGPGSATVLPSGGTGPYSYTWSPSAQSNSIASMPLAGNYTVSVFDTGAGCLTTATTAISSNYVFTGTLSSNNLLCNSANNATANIQLSGGSGNNAYNWSGTAQTSSAITNLAAGFYTITVTDQLSLCSLTKTFQVTQPPVFTVPVSASSASNCVGNGITLNANGSGGTAAYTYTWVSGPAQAGYTVAEPINGTYVYTVNATDANGCTATTTKTLVFTAAPVLIASSATVCSGYTATLNISGANSYTWQPSAFVGSTFTASPAATSVYSITGYIAGCTANNISTATITVVPPPSLTTALSSNTLCEYAFNGSPNTITLTSSGASSYTLYTPAHIGNPNPSGPISPISSVPPSNGSMSTATLQGSNGYCTVANTLTFSIIPNPTISISQPTPVICAGQSFTYTNQGATSYTWGAGTPGIHTYSTGSVAVADPSITSLFSAYGGSLGCNSAIQTSTITVNPLPLISLLPTSPTVCIGSKVNLIATGTSNSYTWSPSAYINSAYGSTVNASPNTQQSYTVVGSLNSCTSTAMITVSVLTLPGPTATVLKPAVCLNETITLQGLGGETYSWYGPNSIYYEGQTVSFVANSYVYTGTYTLTVADKNECKASAITSVTINSLPDGALHGTQMQGCVPFKSDFSFYSALASSSAIATQWTVDQKIFTTKTFSNEFKVPGNYTITGNFRDTLTNCLNSRSFVVEAYPVPIANFSYLPEKPIENLDEVLFTNTSTGEQQTKWNWFFVNNQGYRSENKNTNYLFTEAGLYPIAMMVTNTWGCSDTIVKALKVEADLTVYVPNVFTPNDDNLNEVFLPIVRAVKFYELMVFDRWGTKIFSTTNTEAGWDGSYGGEQCKVDVYVWKINLSSINGEMKTLTGSVLLSR